MNFAYSQLYLNDAITNLGEMTEYAHYACGMDLDLALNCFVISGYAGRFQVGDPEVVSGMSGTELYREMMDKCGLLTGQLPGALVRYDTDEYYWLGYILAYFQWWSGMAFKSITDAIKTDDFMRLYPTMHTVSEERAAEELLELYRKKTQFNRLQEYRKRLGFTQAELAEKSGVNLRTLQQYEVGDKDLAKASVGSVIALAKALHVEPESLISCRVDNNKGESWDIEKIR